MIKTYILNNKDSIYTVLIILIFVTLFWPKENINSISILLLVGFWMLDKSKKLTNIFKSKVLLFITLYSCVAAASLLYSENISKGLELLQRQLPLLIFPVIFLSTKKIPRKNLEIIITALIASCFIMALYCHYYNYTELVRLNKFSFYNFTIKDYFTHYKFTHSHLTRGLDLHPTYFSFFILTALLFLKSRIFSQNLNKKHKIISVIISIYFIGFLFHLSSKLAIVLLFLLLVFYLIQFLLIKKSVKGGIIFSIIMLITLFSVFQIDHVKNRFNDIIPKSQGVDPESDFVKSYKKHRAITLDIYIKQNFKDLILGQGIGDTQEYLDKAYLKYQPELNEKSINSDLNDKPFSLTGLNYHNQYLQVFGSIGLLGGMLFILFIFFPLLKAINQRDEILIIFITLSLFFFLTESVLVRQKGIVFFSLMLSFLYFKSNKKLNG